jgi:hypothetical protein
MSSRQPPLPADLDALLNRDASSREEMLRAALRLVGLCGGHRTQDLAALLPELEEAAAWRSGALLLLDSLPSHADLGERTALVSDPAATVLMFAACTHPDRMLVMSFTLAGEIVDEWSSKRMQFGTDG